MTSSALFNDDRRGPVIQINQVSAGIPGTGLAAGLATGLVPVAFAFRQRRVRLLDFSGADLAEYSFRNTAARWAAQNPQLTPIEMTWAEYLVAAAQTPCPPVAGFLLNVARCGSTLLANMLAAPRGHVTLKESGTVSTLLHRLRTAATEGERREREELLTVTLPLFGRIGRIGPTGGDADDALGGEPATPRLFVKPHSMAMIDAKMLLRLFPQTPAIFLYRAPEEVVASMLARPPYGGLFTVPREQVAAEFPSLRHAPADLSPAAFHAHLWHSPVEDALALPPARVLFLDYAELVSSPLAVIERLIQHCGIDPTPETVARMSGVMGVYAKDASGTARFDPAGEHRRPPLDAAQLADVSGVVGDLYAQLEARRRGQERGAEWTRVGRVSRS